MAPTPKEIKAKAKEIRAWFDSKCDYTLPEHRVALKRAAVMLWRRQTWDEQERNDTKYHNAKGYNGRDADFGGRIVLWQGLITERMAKAAQRMLRKYSRQIAEITLGIP